MRLSLLACALALAPSPVMAQTAAPSAFQASAASADALMRAMHIDRQFDIIIPQIVTMMLGVLLKGNAGHEEQVRHIASEEMTTAFALHRQEMIAVTRDTYRRNFNDAELRDLTTFYESPTGQKFITRQPQIVQESMAGGAAVGQAAARDALPRIIERMKALNLSVPKGA